MMPIYLTRQSRAKRLMIAYVYMYDVFKRIFMCKSKNKFLLDGEWVWFG